MPLTERTREVYERRLEQEWESIDGRPVVRTDRRDGLKLMFDNGSWILVRIAGTEPKIRLYAEGRSSEEMRHLMHAVRQLFMDRRI
jgi:phosphomannomutase